jgi:ABC-type Mn2+/Zn2+ transport system ATPase subunit
VTVVRADGLAVGYDGRPVVEGLDLDVGPGTVLALVGTNGSGKSTLLKTITGLVPAVAGHLEVLGGAPGTRARRLAYLGQFHTGSFVLPLRARDVVRMGRYADHGLLGRMGRVDEELVDEAMVRTGVDHLAKRPLADLSGGQQRRTYLAQVLARRADLLVLDEPTAGIDAAGRDVYEQAVADERARGATVVVATHDIGEAQRADAVLLLAGRVVAQGSPAQVLTPDHLLDAFGMGLHRVEGGLVVAEQPHAHDGHEHLPPGPGDRSR